MASPTVAHRFLERLSTAEDGVRARLLDVYNRFGLSASWFELLAAIDSRGASGCSQTVLAEELGLAESTLCGIVDKLEAAGWLHRFRSRQDRRRSLLLLSQAGRERLAQASAAVDETLDRWLAEISDEELNGFTDWLDRLIARDRRIARWSDAAAPLLAGRDEWSDAGADPRLREAG